ncbi:adenosylmethionine--8-amino-7-oxononanoate transaminase [Corynebacterium pygosceleis]|uniref:Adenosylmethionine-8-amino-7-oxononanoate aminotransferase n=1 Tax=Corynebacterium pygosceleis TaxID=2800406 RepID=A0A9Q4C796_9CORY|nr:adenosylmethionine--8-amino-7-oxononanoate transaminase [Corynebacterium pygosceleis]MCK7637121.1 adenosylmethionine--8-amino-7-oxononanoate transaminase [Corynebacterium pygosceleis]MCK7674595.1 adenosylmethionine--8-amino-7-oxononanoate transaminase [Corynebacterium pygosceleis]MCL0120103.1 adenosylmethionine--8-amino-7-oxononanoate transaminase [Corynebacterium pygosceleis]MCX7443651.1 adenosylmethionine--8-amino-7-oxononanoate transaminase [Corynebacterium pygosceleis]MCX7467875.1 adeno
MTRTVTFDQQHIWHPYSPTPAPVDPLPVASTGGVHITLEDGRTLIDGMSSWWAACHGHGHPALVSAAHRQIDTMSHVMFGGLTHRPAVDLAERLLRIAGEPLNRVFFCDSGSVSVEVAIKMALQYQRGNGCPERKRLITWRSGYHGDTFGPMSVCDPEGGMHALWAGTLTEQIFAPAPPVRGSSPQRRADYLRRVEELIDGTVAAMIIEPVVQGAGGMRFHDHELVAGVRELCDRHGILFIADEIATGFGRTGDLLATRAAGVHADILCLGKALTGGFMSLAAVLATDRVAEGIQEPEGGGALMHGPTFMANPLACAVGSAALDLVEEGYWRETVPRIENELAVGLEPLRRMPHVADVRVLGAIGVVEMDRPVDMRAATDAAVDAGVWLRPFGRLIYTMPPFTATTRNVADICAAITAAAGAGVSE